MEYTIEPIEKLLANDGFNAMCERHWNEVETGEYNPDWNEYIRQEKDDMRRCFCVRADGKLVGYISVLLIKSASNKGQSTAVMEDFFVEKEARKTRAAFGLTRFTMDTLKRIGINKVMADEPLKNGGKDVGAFYKFFGFSPMARIWEREL